ncbi:hypothetical protein H311_00766 [Anncaliia algerae PRA109]|nr:hypothetical protein H311_00766 [Anncaliia algerae PRA109]
MVLNIFQKLISPRKNSQKSLEENKSKSNKFDVENNDKNEEKELELNILNNTIVKKAESVKEVYFSDAKSHSSQKSDLDSVEEKEFVFSLDGLDKDSEDECINENFNELKEFIESKLKGLSNIIKENSIECERNILQVNTELKEQIEGIKNQINDLHKVIKEMNNRTLNLENKNIKEKINEVCSLEENVEERNTKSNHSVDLCNNSFNHNESEIKTDNSTNKNKPITKLTSDLEIKKEFLEALKIEAKKNKKVKH